MFPPIPLPAWLFVTLYGILELFLGVTRREEGVAHFAHLGGMLGAAVCILFWRIGASRACKAAPPGLRPSAAALRVMRCNQVKVNYYS